jgi:hypothetical protein
MGARVGVFIDINEYNYLLYRCTPHPELSDQLGSDNLSGLVKITFLSKVMFVLSSYHSPTFHETIVAN